MYGAILMFIFVSLVMMPMIFSSYFAEKHMDETTAGMNCPMCSEQKIMDGAL